MSTQADRLRATLVRQLADAGMVRTARVEAALRSVPRHAFLPGVPLRQCYADDVTATKRDADGVPISAASQPAIVAVMLEQLDVRPGARILEIGAGTGYNAALLSRLAGPDGRVVTVDVDEDIVAGARSALAGAGTDSVTVLLGDGALGAPGFAPFDRIIATAGLWDLPSAWTEQLAEDGLIVAPLRLRGAVTRSVALRRQDPGPPGPPVILRSESSVTCGFMPLRDSIASDPRRTITLNAARTAGLEVQQDQDADPERLAGVLDTARTPVRTGVEFRGRAWAEDLYLWLTCALPGGLYGMRVAAETAEARAVAPLARRSTMATAAGDSLAYLAAAPSGQATELQVVGHGPGGGALAETATERIRAWARDYQGRSPGLTVIPVSAAPDQAPEPVPGSFVLRTPRALTTVTWGAPGPA